MTTGTETTVGSVNLLDLITADRELPEGYDGWAIRTVHPDFTSSRGFKYPFPGGVAEAPGPFTASGDPCPSREGDGICAAGTWAGMASGGVSAGGTLLLVAYKNADVLAGSIAEKLRTKRLLVVDVIDGGRLLREYGASANLGYADLRSADLGSADLRSADLGYADLRYADLWYADLRYAYLRYADLRSADLGYADLRYADLSEALNLTSSQIRGAYTNEWTRLPSGVVVPS